jgi:DNA-directed RNA polymerase omega subunit
MAVNLDAKAVSPSSSAVSPPTDEVAGAARWPGIDSTFRLIVVAALRSKQLVRGSLPRIEADPQKRKNISIALEEVKQGLIGFTLLDEEGNATERRV